MKTSKKIAAVCLVLLSLIFVLVGCKESKSPDASSAPASSTVAPDTREDAIEAFKKVLKNEEPVYYEMTEISVLLKETGYMKDDTMEIAVEFFAVVDFEGDGVPEMVLSRKPDDNRLLLQYRNGKVHAVTRPLRGMNELKQDGSFYASNSATQTEIQKLYFELGEFETIVLASVNDGKYTVDGKDATKSEYEAIEKEQDEKDNVVWNDFTDANLETDVFTGFFGQGRA